MPKKAVDLGTCLCCGKEKAQYRMKDLASGRDLRVCQACERIIGSRNMARY